MNILYIAYSCAPFNGSEDKIGWSVPLESSKTNQVFVITKEEQRESIEKYLANHTLNNARFYYVDIPTVHKKLLKGFLYSGRLRIWNKRALKVAREICAQEKIQVIHQITPIEFRAIGDYYKIPNTKFICGPLGGGETLPKGLKDYARGHQMVEKFRCFINRWCRLVLKVTDKLKKCDYVMFANHETREYLDDPCQPVFTKQIFFDNGLRKEEMKSEEISEHSSFSQRKNRCTFLVAGRLIYRKGHMFLLDALMRLPDHLDYECRIVGGGPEMDVLQAKCCANQKLKKHVVFTGAIPYNEMEMEYNRANAFIMPSIRETTGTVLLEAMANGIPVITINKFGGATILDNNTGWLYDGQTKEEYIDGLKNAIVSCITQPEEVFRRGQNARRQAEKYVWEEKVKHYQSIYDDVVDFSPMK